MWKRASVSSGQRLGRGTRFISPQTCEEDHPNLITNVAATAATVPDTELLNPIHAHLAERDLLPATHLVDAVYVDAGIDVPEALVHHVEVIGSGRRRHQLAGGAGAGICSGMLCD